LPAARQVRFHATRLTPVHLACTRESSPSSHALTLSAERIRKPLPPPPPPCPAFDDDDDDAAAPRSSPLLDASPPEGLRKRKTASRMAEFHETQREARRRRKLRATPPPPAPVPPAAGGAEGGDAERLPKPRRQQQPWVFSLPAHPAGDAGSLSPGVAQPLLADPPPAAAPPPPPPPPALLPPLRECCVCFADVAVADLLALLPCMHRCVCGACAGRIVDAPCADARTCPKCRVHVERASRVFED
jgi:hypothetical protein